MTAFTYERHEQAAVFRWAKLNERRAPALRLLNASMNGISLGGSKESRARTIKAAHAQGMRNGFPDIALPVPGNGWHALFIELKREDGVLEPEQKEWLDLLTEYGNLATACWGAVEAIEELSEYVGIGR